MAMSAFKSTTKRTPIGSQENSSTASPKGKSDSSKTGGRRRSRSLSRFPKHYAEISSSTVLRQIDVQNNEEKRPPSRNVSPVRDFKPGRFVNTVRGSGVPEDPASHVTAFLQPNRVDTRGRGGRALSHYQTDSANDSQSEAEMARRRGRSVSRNPPKQELPPADNGRRRRSASVAPYQFSDSESDIDSLYNQTEQQRLNNIGTAVGQRHVSEKVAAGDLPKYQRRLSRCSSQRNLSRSHDSYSSYASTLTDDEGLEMRSSDYAEEKTISAVHAQMKSFQSDHPTGDMDAVRLYEAMRSEVRHAVAEIRFELEQANAKIKSSATTANGSNNSLEPKSTDVIQAVADIRKDYTAKLEQSEKRARDLWAELAVEEQRCHELAKIVEELLPEPKSSQNQRPSRTRKKSADRKRMSKCLNEEAQKYFDEFVSISKIEDSEISSLEEEQNDVPAHDIKAETGVCEGSLPEISHIEGANRSHNIKQAPLPAETDGVLLPWLQWETDSDNTPQFSMTNMDIVMTAKKHQQNMAEDMGSGGSNSSCGSTSMHVASSNGSNSSWSPNNSSCHYSISNVDPSIVEHMNLSSTRNSGESRDEEYHSKHKAYNIAITKRKGCVRSPTVRSSYQDDEYILQANNEAILNEQMKLKSRIEFGGLILCGSKLL